MAKIFSLFDDLPAEGMDDLIVQSPPFLALRAYLPKPEKDEEDES